MFLSAIVVFGGGVASMGSQPVPVAPSTGTPAVQDPVAPLTVINPVDDPFYSQPTSFAGRTNGEVLGSRTANIAGLGSVLTSYQLRYVSSDTDGVHQANVATVLLPLHSSSPPKLVSYQIAINSLTYDCDPSYTLRKGTEGELTYISALLAKGWTVVVPDFLGPNHQWAAGYVEARGTLDGIRAALNFTPAGLTSSSPVGLVGYSGGARGTEFGNELAATYAPELNIVGAAAGGLAVDVGAVMAGANGGLFAGVYFAGTFGLDRAYPEMAIDSILNAEGVQMKKDIATMCIEKFIATYAFQKFERYTIGGVNPLSSPVFQSVLAKVKGGQYGLPKAPTYFYMAVYDELVVPENAEALAKRYCDAGLAVEYVTVAGEHASAQPAGFAGAVGWLADRFAGVTAPNNCSTD